MAAVLPTPNPQPESWAVVPEAPLYDVSTWGRVRRGSFDVASWPNAKGYHLVSIEIDDVPRLRYVHRLVLTAFRGLKPDFPLVNHENLCKGDNVLGNLAWTTPVGNSAHYRRARARAAGQLELFV